MTSENTSVTLEEEILKAVYLNIIIYIDTRLKKTLILLLF